MKFLQKLGKAIMLPVACLPLCGILMGLGYLMCPSTMQGGEAAGFIPMLGMFLVKAGSALIDNIAILFAVGVGVGMGAGVGVEVGAGVGVRVGIGVSVGVFSGVGSDGGSDVASGICADAVSTAS